jgi:hypothetical protein
VREQWMFTFRFGDTTFRSNMANWTGKAFGTDVYRGAQSIKIPSGGLDFGICKMGGSNGGLYIDDKFAAHVQSFYDCGAAVMAYWYCDPSWYLNREFTLANVKAQSNADHKILQTILQASHNGSVGWKAIRALFFDVETEGAGDVWNQTYVEDLRERLVGLMSVGQYPKIPLGIYSRAGYVNAQPALRTWIEQHPEIIIWTANYTTAYPGKLMPISDYRTNGLPMATQNPIWFGDNPAKPKQYKRFWQYHGTFPGAQYSTCPEIMGASAPAGLDLDIFEGTRAELFEMLKTPDPLVTPPEPPAPPVDDHAAILERINKIEAVVVAQTNIIQTQEIRITALENWRKS